MSRCVPVLCLALLAGAVHGQLNGFELSRASIAREEIVPGGPPRDGIPALLKPRFVPAGRATFLADNDLVIGVVRGDQARAYPIRILNWHEVVNDSLKGRDILVTYCPLTGSAMVFERPGRAFGVSGLLYRSNLLMYDHQSESLWSQLAMKAVAGSAAGRRLVWLPSRQTTWRAWRRQHPGTWVLSTDTGYDRDYTKNPYADYEQDERVLFPVPMFNRALPAKARVAGLFIEGRPVAFPVDWLPEEWTDGARRLRRDATAPSVIATREDGEEVPVVTAFWFAWQAFYPETKLQEIP